MIVQLAELKAKSIAFTFNNLKIRKIISIQRRKETVRATVEKLQEKLRRWRRFTRTTLDTTAPAAAPSISRDAGSGASAEGQGSQVAAVEGERGAADGGQGDAGAGEPGSAGYQKGDDNELIIK